MQTPMQTNTQTTLTPSAKTPETAAFRAILPAGEPWVQEIKAGQTVRILDLEGNQAVDTLFFNLNDTEERFDPQRTLRRQQSLYITTGTVLYSNRGNALLTVVADTCGRHDTLGGACAQESNSVRYALDKRFMHSCRDNFLRACAHDKRLGKRDIGANINFFMNVPVTEQGGLTFEDGISAPGKYVELRAEMDVLMLISNCPQLNNPCNAYNPTPAELLIWN